MKKDGYTAVKTGVSVPSSRSGHKMIVQMLDTLTITGQHRATSETEVVSVRTISCEEFSVMLKAKNLFVLRMCCSYFENFDFGCANKMQY